MDTIVYAKVQTESDRIIAEIRGRLYQSRTVTPTEQTQTVQPQSGYNALSVVTVNPIPPNYIIPTGSLPITENGTYDVTDKAQVVVNIDTGAALSDLEIYVADFRTEPPTMTEGALNVFHRTLVS